MKVADRYIFLEVAKAVAGGLLLLVGMVVCVYQLQDFIRLLVREAYPPLAAAKSFLYVLPQSVGWVAPTAIIFGTIMAVGRMSGDGELIAMQAGGISFRRMLVPVALVGLAGVAFLHFVTEVVAPRTLRAAQDLVMRYSPRGAPVTGFAYTDKEGDEVLRHVFAARMDPATWTLSGVVLIEFDGSQAKQVITARTARWVGEWLDLDDVQTSRRAGNGSLIVELDRARHRVGLPPTDLQHRPETMTIPQMRSRIAELRAKSAPVAQYIRPLEQAIAVRRATPWCALGFALVSAPLGIRRVRASTGVSFGLAILVFLPYYFVSYTLQVLNKHGGIHPEIPAWTANILLLVVATGLIIDRSR